MLKEYVAYWWCLDDQDAILYLGRNREGKLEPICCIDVPTGSTWGVVEEPEEQPISDDRIVAQADTFFGLVVNLLALDPAEATT